MTLVGTSESGAEEWSCTECARRIVMTWPPDYEKLVLDQGDMSVIHTGGKGGVTPRSVLLSSVPPPPDESWLTANGIEW